MRNITLNLIIVAIVSLLLTACVAEDNFLYPFSSVSDNKTIKDNSSSKPKIQRKSKYHKGKSVTCHIKEGQAHFANGWLPLKDTDFTIKPGDIISINVLNKRKIDDKVSLTVKLSENTQKTVFCPIFTGARAGQKISCTSIYALDDDYDLGIKRTFDVPKLIRGSTILCKHNL